MKPKNLKLIALAHLIVVILYLPFYAIGCVLYLLSKVLVLLASLLCTDFAEFNRTIRNFWRINY